MKKDFTYEQFTNEQKDYHVFNQEKYTKEEALEITKKNMKMFGNMKSLRLFQIGFVWQ